MPLKKLKSFRSNILLSSEIDLFIKNVNAMIDVFNKAEYSSDKIKILPQLQKKIEVIDDTYPRSVFAASPEYRAFHAAIFEAVQKEITEPQSASSLPEIIANMSPQKTDTLLKILQNKPCILGDLNSLYEATDISLEAKNFRLFLDTHTINFLGGTNSKNFLVTNDKNKQFVLKVDNRLNIPRDIENYLRQRNALEDRFTSIEAKRQAACIIEGGETISRTLLVTEYCSQGNLLDTRVGIIDAEAIEKAIQYFIQMATILLDIEASGCVFTDGKLENWLVQNGNLLISDGKGFLSVNQKGKFIPDSDENKYYSLVSSPGFFPLEFATEDIHSDSTHAFLLGKNMYFYLSQMFYHGFNANFFDFDLEIFKTEEGQKFKTLIHSSMQLNYRARKAVKDVLNDLIEIFLIKHTEFAKVFKELQSLQFGAIDSHTNRYIATTIQKIYANTEQKTAILSEVTDLLKNLQKDPGTTKIRQLINNYRTNAGFFTIGMNEKAAMIEQAMSEIPLLDRCNLNRSQKTEHLEKALAYHRHPWRRLFDKQQKVPDPEKAAKGFRNYTLFKDKTSQETAPKPNNGTKHRPKK